jgi:acyl-coenzyme A synthetase/AMP-(fatty) acid ligase
MIPELAVSMLACARIGAIHLSLLGFSAPATRIIDSDVKWSPDGYCEIKQ